MKRILFSSVCISLLFMSCIGVDYQTGAYYQDHEQVNKAGKAAEAGDTETLKLLLEKDVNVNAVDDYGSNLLLTTAAGHGHIDVVKLLLEKGAEVNATGKKDKITALMAASLNDHTEIVRLLLEKGANVNAKDIVGGTALGAAKEAGHTDIVKLLKKAGAKK
jgi:uncharacterized protein